MFSSLRQAANRFCPSHMLQGTRPSSIERQLLPFVASPLLCKGYEKGPPKRTAKHSLAKVLSWHRNGIYNVEGSVNSAPLYPEEVRLLCDSVSLWLITNALLSHYRCVCAGLFFKQCSAGKASFIRSKI